MEEKIIHQVKSVSANLIYAEGISCHFTQLWQREKALGKYLEGIKELGVLFTIGFKEQFSRSRMI